MFSHVFVYRILKSTLNEGHHVIGNAVGIYYFNNTCLITLYILHIIWFHFILKMCYRFVVDGQVMWTVLHAWSCASMRGALAVILFTCVMTRVRVNANAAVLANVCHHQQCSSSSCVVSVYSFSHS